MEIMESSDLGPTELRHKRRLLLNDIETSVNPTEFRQISDGAVFSKGRKVQSVNGVTVVSDDTGSVLNKPGSPIKGLDTQLAQIEQGAKVAPTAFTAGDAFISKINNPTLKARASNHTMAVMVPRVNDLAATLKRVGGPASYDLSGMLNTSEIGERLATNKADIFNKYNLIISAIMGPQYTDAYQNPNDRPSFDHLKIMVRALNDDIRTMVRADSADIAKFGGMDSTTLNTMLDGGLRSVGTLSEEILSEGNYGTRNQSIKQQEVFHTLSNNSFFQGWVQTLPPDLRTAIAGGAAMSAISSQVALANLAGAPGISFAQRLLGAFASGTQKATLTKLEEAKSFDGDSMRELLGVHSDRVVLDTTTLTRLITLAEKALEEKPSGAVTSALHRIIKDSNLALKETAPGVDKIHAELSKGR
jgi:hypothetical protein